MDDPYWWVRVLCCGTLGGLAGLFFSLWMTGRDKIQALLNDLEHWKDYYKERDQLADQLSAHRRPCLDPDCKDGYLVKLNYAAAYHCPECLSKERDQLLTENEKLKAHLAALTGRYTRD